MTTVQNNYLPLLNFFIFHLNRLYYTKAHLVSKLPGLQGLSRLPSLTLALEKMEADLHRQIGRIEQIFNLLDASLDPGAARPINDMIECAYQDITGDPDGMLGNLSILYYLEVLEGIEMSCFKLLRMAAVKLGNSQIKKLLQQNYKSAKHTRTLLLLIATELITGQSSKL